MRFLALPILVALALAFFAVQAWAVQWLWNEFIADSRRKPMGIWPAIAAVVTIYVIAALVRF